MLLFKFFFITRGKIKENSIRKINLNSYLQHGMMNLNCQMVLIMCQIFIIISNTSLKKHETLTTLTTIPPIHVYINRINNRLVFKKQDGIS